MASSGSKVRERERERERERDSVARKWSSQENRGSRRGTRWLLKYSHLKPPKVVLLTVTSIQRAQGPGDARPPENCGHVTDPPHPDP